MGDNLMVTNLLRIIDERESALQGLEEQLEMEIALKKALMESQERLGAQLAESQAHCAAMRKHIERALDEPFQGSCPVCGDDYPEDLADGCVGCVWAHDAQRILDSSSAGADFEARIRADERSKCRPQIEDADLTRLNNEAWNCAVEACARVAGYSADKYEIRKLRREGKP